MKVMGIYKITNKINGKMYIGSSNNIYLRWKSHIKDLNNNKHHSYKLQNAWNKYGEENFEFEIIETLEVYDKDYILDREQYWLDITKCYSDDTGYNVSHTSRYLNICKRYKPPVNDNTTITTANEDIKITKNEFDAILKQCNKKNEKILAHVMLVHSKKFSDENKYFYMTFKQMSEFTGLGLRTVKELIEKLIAQQVVVPIERNKKVNGNTWRKLPNMYQMSLKIEQNENDEINKYISDLYSIHEKDFVQCLNIYYTKTELRILLPRRQYEGLCGIL